MVKLKKHGFFLFFILASFLLISIQASAGVSMEMPPPPPPSNCCSAHECIDIKSGDSDDWGDSDSDDWGDDDDDGAGCDDPDCESLVCNFEPECCQCEEVRYVTESRYIEGGWNEFCAELANNFCEVCGGENPLDAEITSDEDPFQLYSFFDLRDRDSFVQVTNVSGGIVTVHVQIFDVDNNCNENNFYDVYTGNDTHIYNMSNILTNDGNPSGVSLPDDAYGMVIVTVVTGVGGPTDVNSVLIGNFRILDAAGYEYRTNSVGIRTLQTGTMIQFNPNYYFNYNIRGDVTLSDVVGITIRQNPPAGEVEVAPPGIFAEFDIDIFNTNEVPFSCRDIIFACIDEDNPLLEQLLAGDDDDDLIGGIISANVASFEYGINNVIPHSRGGELLCPGNNIPEGFVVLRPEFFVLPEYDEFIGYVGLNSGNGRGSMDSFWHDNIFLQNLVLPETG